MPNLSGLSPDEINNIRNTDVAEQNLLFNAANALGKLRADQAQTAAYINANTPSYQTIDFNGTKYNIPDNQIAATLETLRKNASDKDKITWHLPGGGVLAVNSELSPNMLTALTSMQRTPFQNKVDSAVAALQGAQANEIQEMLPFRIGAETQKAHEAWTNARGREVETQQKEAALLAAKALAGVPADELFNAQNAGNAYLAAPSSIPALANKFDANGGISDANMRQYSKYLTDLSANFATQPKTVTPGDTEAYNAIAAKIGLTNAWVYTSDGPKQISLPMPVGDAMAKLKTKNITFEDIAEEAEKRGMDIQDFLPYVFNALEAK